MTVSAYFNPPDFSGAGVVNTAAWRSAQIPSANAHATATGIARLYAPLAAGGGTIVDGGALAAATRQQVYGDDLVLRRPSRFGLGYQLTHPEREFAPRDRVPRLSLSPTTVVTNHGRAILARAAAQCPMSCLCRGPDRPRCHRGDGRRPAPRDRS